MFYITENTNGTFTVSMDNCDVTRDFDSKIEAAQFIHWCEATAA